MHSHFLVSFIAATALLAGAANATSRKPDGDAALARITAGRTAGAPVDCLRQSDIQSSQIVDRTAIVYTGRNGTLYVNRPASGAAFLQDGLALVTDTHSDQLCSIDSVRLVDMSVRMDSGSVGLGKFIPYPRPARAR